jgi:BarA-like signal transduction histidine kinase
LPTICANKEIIEDLVLTKAIAIENIVISAMPSHEKTAERKTSVYETCIDPIMIKKV